MQDAEFRFRTVSGTTNRGVAMKPGEQGGCMTCRARRVQVARAFFPRGEREAIEDLSCQAPASVGWKITH